MTTPGNVATSQNTAASTGSPSGANVDGTNPQSTGYRSPSGNGREIDITPRSGSYFSLTAEPRGDSTTTWKMSSPTNVGSRSSVGMRVDPLSQRDRIAGVRIGLAVIEPERRGDRRRDLILIERRGIAPHAAPRRVGGG